ncbi:MAG: HEAT repeat domain-containing protein [Synechococcaceae cyanobacterium SM2_3_2]|nr:HEAT repeat domain-containing protein [Synechococcaceae cyanobacterium SM2_3_2]
MSFPPVSQSVSQSDGGTGSPDLELLVQHLEQATDPGQMVRAVEALGSCGQVGALPHLIKAFGFNRPGVADRALAAVVAFGQQAVEPLLSAIDGYDYGARAYSVRALARIGDPRAFEFLVEAIQTDFAPSVKRAAVRGLGPVASAGDAHQQARALDVLTQSLQDPDWGLRYAALCGLAEFQPQGSPPAGIRELVARVWEEDPDSLVRVKALGLLQPEVS